MYFAEIIYRLSYCQLVHRRSPSAFLAVVQFSDFTIGGYDRFSRVRLIVFRYECDRSFTGLCKIFDHSLDCQFLAIWDTLIFVFHFNQYVLHIVILNKSVDICWVEASIKFQALEINELLCVVRIFDSASFRNHHPLVFGDRLQNVQQLSFRGVGMATCLLLGAPQQMLTVRHEFGGKLRIVL